MGRYIPMSVMVPIRRLLYFAGIFGWGGAMGSGPVKGFNSEEVQNIITKKHDATQNKIAKEDADTATFAAGCFWGVQLAFQRVPGVALWLATQQAILNIQHTMMFVADRRVILKLFRCSSIQLLSYKELLKVLFDRMDPTTLNRQGNDRGTQYRSGIYYHSEDQKEIALNFIKEIQPKYKDSIVVEVKKAEKFWPAEDYHQKYLEKGG